jgi:hypothetical protein
MKVCLNHGICVSGSPKLGTINPTSLIKMLQRGGKPTMLSRAMGEFGAETIATNR